MGTELLDPQYWIRKSLEEYGISLTVVPPINEEGSLVNYVVRYETLGRILGEIRSMNMSEVLESLSGYPTLYNFVCVYGSKNLGMNIAEGREMSIDATRFIVAHSGYSSPNTMVALASQPSLEIAKEILGNFGFRRSDVLALVGSILSLEQTPERARFLGDMNEQIKSLL